MFYRMICYIAPEFPILFDYLLLSHASAVLTPSIDLPVGNDRYNV